MTARCPARPARPVVEPGRRGKREGRRRPGAALTRFSSARAAGYGTTRLVRIISESSWELMWQCHTYGPEVTVS